jgi:hypothetical protein
LGEFAVGAGEADLESFCLAGPAFAFGLCDAGQEVVANVFQLSPVTCLPGIIVGLFRGITSCP